MGQKIRIKKRKKQSFYAFQMDQLNYWQNFQNYKNRFTSQLLASLQKKNTQHRKIGKSYVINNIESPKKVYT